MNANFVLNSTANSQDPLEDASDDDFNAIGGEATTLQILEELNPYPELQRRAARLEAGLRDAATAAGIPAVVNRAGSMLTTFFTADPVTDYATARHSDTEKYGRFFRAMLERGVYLAPSQFEAAFVSAAHTEEDIRRAGVACHESLAAIPS